MCPGYVRTPLVEKQIPDQARAHGLSEEDVLEQVILAPHAVKRLIEPSEVAEVVAFLAGPAGRPFTGVPVTMDQGWTRAVARRRCYAFRRRSVEYRRTSARIGGQCSRSASWPMNSPR